MGGRTLFKDYLHLNGEGNNLVAAALESYLADNLPALIGTGSLDLSEVCLLPDPTFT